MNTAVPAPESTHSRPSIFRVFGDVRGGEAATAAAMALNVFLLLLAYYLLKVAREPLILMNGGAEVKSYAAAGQSVALVGVAFAYSALARRVPRMKLIAFVTLFFVADLIAFATLGLRGVPVAVPFYLWVGVFNLTAVAQFWSFAADIYDEGQGQRLFPILGIGSSVGAVAGAWIAKRMIHVGPFGLMLIAALVLLLCLALTAWVDRRAPRRRAERDEPLGGDGGFTLLLRDRYLLLIGALALLMNVVNTTGEYLLDRTLLETAHESAVRSGMSTAEFVGAFKGKYFAWVNGLGLFMQLFVVSRVIGRLGVRGALVVLPAVSIAFYAGVFALPLLPMIFAAKVAENSLDYSLQNTTKQTLWLPVDRAAKYKAKQVVDTFLVRAGDVASAGLVLLGARFAFHTRHFVIANLVVVALWCVTLVFLARAHRKRVA